MRRIAGSGRRGGAAPAILRMAPRSIFAKKKAMTTGMEARA